MRLSALNNYIYVLHLLTTSIQLTGIETKLLCFLNKSSKHTLQAFFKEIQDTLSPTHTLSFSYLSLPPPPCVYFWCCLLMQLLLLLSSHITEWGEHSSTAIPQPEPVNKHIQHQTISQHMRAGLQSIHFYICSICCLFTSL